MEENDNGWQGFKEISRYTRAQALEDGFLVDISVLAKEAGFRWPVAVSRAVWALLEPSAALQAEGQSWEGRAWDMLTILRYAIHRSADGSEVSFAPLFVKTPGSEPEPVSLWAKCGPGDTPEPVITIMLPSED